MDYEKLVQIFREEFPGFFDISDYGDAIGRILAQLPQFAGKNSIDIDDFIAGFRHGVSIIDGTHDNPDKEGFLLKRKPKA